MSNQLLVHDIGVSVRIDQPEVVVPGKRLGRHIRIDTRSALIANRVQVYDTALHSVTYQRHVPIYDQGNVGMCEGTAWAGVLCTGPFNHMFGIETAKSIYRRATEIDQFAGQYPEEDTGTDTISAATACRDFGFIKGWQNAFTLQEMLQGMMSSPCVFACDWFEGFDEPGRNGFAIASGSIRGGHAFVACAVDHSQKIVRFANSWSDSYGDNGYFELSYPTVAALLATCADCAFPIE